MHVCVCVCVCGCVCVCVCVRAGVVDAPLCPAISKQMRSGTSAAYPWLGLGLGFRVGVRVRVRVGVRVGVSGSAA